MRLSPSTAVVWLALPLMGCESMSNTEKGVGAGGLIGAGTGALIGNATGHTGAGALIGAAVGAVTGGLIGDAVDESEKKNAVALAAATAPARPTPLGVTDVVQLAQSHVSDEVIVSQIRASGSVFNLSANDTIWLKQQGVSDLVVQEMLATPGRCPQRYYPARVVYTRPAYLDAPRPMTNSGYYGDPHTW